MSERATIRIAEESPDRPGVLERYAGVSIAFRVTSRLAVRRVDQGLGGLLLQEEAVAVPYSKDYDACESPLRWRNSFDLSRWALFTAFEGVVPVGGAILAWNTPGVEMLEGRDDLAVLWDLRVHPDFRQVGVGHQLFRAAEAWARQKGCCLLRVETQNINVPACRFYARHGCELRTIRLDAYPEFPDEAQLLWYKPL